MADKIINSGVVFAYSSNDAFFELKNEFEKYFLYQNILFVDLNFEYGNVIEKLRQNTNCNILTCHKLEKNMFENIDFVVIVNDKFSSIIKMECFKRKIPYMNVLTKLNSYSVCCDKIFDENNCQKTVSLPFGIVLDKSQIFNKKDFVFDAIIEIASSKIDIMQKRFCNMFFNEKIDFEKYKSSEKILKKLDEILCDKSFENNKFFDELCDTYVMNLIKRANDDIDILDIISKMFCSEIKSKKFDNAKIKYLYMQILTYIQKDFLQKYKVGYCQTIDYHAFQNKLCFYNKNADFSTQTIPENKINFLFEQFKSKLDYFANEQFEFVEKIKEQLAEIDVDKLYALSMDIDRKTFVDMICLEPIVYQKNSFLKVMLFEGLLNFQI